MLFVSLITFVLMHSVEGGPWDREKKLPDAVVQNLNVKYGLDQPLYQQYGTFVWNALRGDIGISFQRQDQPVRDILVEGFKVTCEDEDVDVDGDQGDQVQPTSPAQGGNDLPPQS